MNLRKENEWLWNSRWTQWVVKKVGDNVDEMRAPCMDPLFLGPVDDEQIIQNVQEFKKANINTVLTEGLRRLILFEQKGITDQVIEVIKRATEECHKEGIKIIHHTTTTLVGQDLDMCTETQLEWLSMDADTGEKAYLNIWDGWYLWCMNNPGFRTEYFRLAKKLTAETGIDGFMTDEAYFRTGWYNCSCPHCVKKFKSKTGYDLPGAEESSFWGNFKNPEFRAWLNFRLESVGDFYADLHQALTEAHPHPVLLGCKNDEPTPMHSQYYGENNDQRMRGTNVLFVESSAPSNFHSWKRLAACLMSYLGYSLFYSTPTLSVMYHSANEGFFCWALRIANGMRVWATGSVTLKTVLSPKNQFLNFPDDVSLYSELFTWEETHKTELAGNISPFANIGLLLSSSTRDMADHDGSYNYYVREFIGWGETLTDAYLQYTVLLEQGLSLSNLQKYALLILPNASCMSDSNCQIIMDYIAKGGCVILTNETSIYDETGTDRPSQNQLMNVLGGSIEPTQKTDIAQFGKHGLGKWVYFSHKPGMSAYFSTNVLDEPKRRDTEEAPFFSNEDRILQTSMMREAVRWCAADTIPLKVKQAPEGLLIKAYQDRYEKKVIVHILNCMGEKDVAFGEMIQRDIPIPFPKLNMDIILDIEVESVSDAYLFSPDWDGRRKLKQTKIASSSFRFEIPSETLLRYEVLYIQT